MKKISNHDHARNDRPFGFQNLTVYKKMIEYLDLEQKVCRAFPAILRDQLAAR